MIDDSGWAAVASSLALSKRQLQIVRAVFDDSTEFAISRDFGISQHTVHTHLERIHHKFHVHSRVELVVFVLTEFLRLTADGSVGLPPVCPHHKAGRCHVNAAPRGSGASLPSPH